MPMNPKTADRWAWILIYSGLGLVIVGWFLRDTLPAAALATMVAGAADALAGVGLVVWRARLPEPDPGLDDDHPKEKR